MTPEKVSLDVSFLDFTKAAIYLFLITNHGATSWCLSVRYWTPTTIPNRTNTPITLNTFFISFLGKDKTLHL